MTLKDFALDYTKQFDPNSRALITDFVDQWEEYRKDNLTIEDFGRATIGISLTNAVAHVPDPVSIKMDDSKLDMPYLGQGDADNH